MRSKIPIGIAFLFISSIAYSQAGTLDIVKNPQSPDAAGLGKYVEMPVGYYNGIPAIGVPLYDMDVKGFKLPVSLSYHASGIKVLEIPGSVGAGWSLNAGGVITRIVRGFPDYYTGIDSTTRAKVATSGGLYQGSTGSSTSFYTMEQWNILLSTPGVEVVGPGNQTFQGAIRDVCQYTPSRMNTEIDEYYFNFFNYTGKFTFTNKGQPILLSEADLKIEYVSGSATFKITDGQGVQYFFEAKETQYDDGMVSPYYTSAWYISKVYIPSTDQTVNFTYKSYDTFYTPLYPYWNNGTFLNSYRSPVYGIRYSLDGFPDPTLDSYGEIPRVIGGPRDMRPPGIGTTLFIDSITWEDKKIKFYGGLTRMDMYKYELDSIKVSSAGIPIRNIQLNYSYFNPWEDWYKLKLKLQSVTVGDQVYGFGYIDSVNGKTLPPIYSTGKDLWGYYNGWSAPDSFPSFKLLSKMGYGPGTNLFGIAGVYVGTGMNKCPDPQYAQIGTLSWIQYPTGGKTYFEYEGNDFTQCSFTNNVETDCYGQLKFHPIWKLGSNIWKAGGLRIKKIRFDPGNGGGVMEKAYSYRNAASDSSTGVLESPIANISYSVKYGTPGWYIFDGNKTGCWHLEGYYVNLGSDPVIPLGNAKGGIIGYSTVTETRQDGSKTVYHFTNGTQSGKGDDFSVSGYCDSTGTRLRVLADNSWKRGLPEQVDYYNNTSGLLKQDFTQYLFNDYNTDSLSLSLFLTDVKFTVPDPCGIPPQCFYGGYNTWNNFIWARNEKLYKQLDSSILYTPSGNITQATRYEYHPIFSSPVHNYPIKISTTNSRGEVTITNLKYPQDYTVGSSPSDSRAVSIKGLLDKHITAPVIEKYVQKKDANGSNLRTTSGEFVKYQQTNPLPDTVYNLQLQFPVTNFQTANIVSGSSSIDSRYKPTVAFTVYDSKGNIVSANKPDDMQQSFIWDYKGLYMIAQVTNAFSTIAHTSFEADGVGGWNISAAAVTDTTAPTGKKCYYLSSSNILSNIDDLGGPAIVSYWSKNGPYTVSGFAYSKQGQTINGWTYYEHEISNRNNATFSGTGYIDEVRLYPKGALMTTYTYAPLVGMTTKCDANNRINYYEYNSDGRLRLIRDENRNIIKKITYKYNGQPEN